MRMSSSMRWRSGVPGREVVSMVGLQSMNEADCLARQLGRTATSTCHQHIDGALPRIRRDFPPSSNGVEAPRLSCDHQSETEKGKPHERDYTSSDSAGRC